MIHHSAMRAALTILCLASPFPRAFAQREAATAVEPAELVRREDLVGKLVAVDDRIRFFQNHPSSGYDELYLRRTPIAFRLPESLRPDVPPRNPAVIVQGRLVREGSRHYVDVTDLKLQPSDQERFDRAIAALSARDYEQKREWVRWASRRAKDFSDESLASRAKTVEAEALRNEAESKRATVDAPREWLDLAREGRKRGVAEPDPSALAHRAFRAMLSTETTPAALRTLKGEVESFFPAAADGVGTAEPPPDVLARYEQDAAAAYRSAPVDVRKSLDRRIWADVVQKLLEAEAGQDVRSAIEVVNRAVEMLPDRPQFAARLIDQVQGRARADLGSLRFSEAKTVGSLLEQQGKNPPAALAFYRDWLISQRDRLGDSDAEGPIALAGYYDSLLHDSEGARQMLERAWKIAPESEAVTEAFRSRGYRRVGEDWVKDAPSVEAPASNAGPVVGVDQGLRGKTPGQVRAAMGIEPTSKAVVGTKGRVVLQWIFDEPRQRRYVNFLAVPGSPTPRVVSDYLLPR